jgi:hypothetical protein
MSERYAANYHYSNSGLMRLIGRTVATYTSSRADYVKSKKARPEYCTYKEEIYETQYYHENMIDIAEQVDFLGSTQADLQR